MRYAIFSDIHANLEALEAVLAKIDEIAKEKPIDQIWFLGDLVGYGPDPNACITKLRERTDVIIAGNHDWAAVNKIDLEEFSAAARISAEWTAEQLTEEHREFLANLPERLDMGECTLVHGSPYGPLWEYLTSEVLAERSFEYFSSRFCFVGHTHLPVIFLQPVQHETEPDLESTLETSTLPADETDQEPANAEDQAAGEQNAAEDEVEEEDVVEATVAQSALAASNSAASQAESAYADPETGQPLTEGEANAVQEVRAAAESADTEDEAEDEEESETGELDEDAEEDEEEDGTENRTSEEEISNAEERLNSEIEELLALLGLSQSMIRVTNEMRTPPEGHWDAPEGYRAIINPGGVGQPRDGDPRAAFMIYDTEEGFDFYRVPYDIAKTQEKIIKAGLPQYLAVRLAYGR